MEMQKWKFRRRPGRDVFDMLGLDPLDEWKVRRLFSGGADG